MVGRGAGRGGAPSHRRPYAAHLCSCVFGHTTRGPTPHRRAWDPLASSASAGPSASSRDMCVSVLGLPLHVGTQLALQALTVGGKTRTAAAAAAAAAPAF